ncbi:hypothetical protein HPB50_024051 [Hyalomma asiaticum]|uniref:Uncharacterized protein n=1 Tax=Hyalomma asiaticum TaxID=266040 RepID=A0ACB7SSV6_HYAAI|nr:hypothetical protein HPB50_024051 [Hyalomma asiaticum]
MSTLQSVRWLTADQLARAGFHGQRLIRLSSISSTSMASTSTSSVRCPHMIVLLVGYCGVLTPVRCQELAQCGRICGGYTMRMCVVECDCVFLPADFGICMPSEMNGTLLLPFWAL